MIRGALVAVGMLVVCAVAGGFYLNWMMKQPLYRLGDVAAGKNLRGSLIPPDQKEDSVWTVEHDIQLHFVSRGTGKPALVVHGGPGIPYADTWKGLEPLTDRYQFHYYHQRGCGNSSRPFDRFEGNFYQNMIQLERTLGLGAQIADIERIRRILGRDKITLIGHSFGGLIATLYAAEFPDRVEKLVLVAPAGVLTPPDEERDLFKLARGKLSDEDKPKYDELVRKYFDFGKIFSKSDAELADLHLQVGGYLLKAMGNRIDPNHAGPPSGGWVVFAMYFSCGRAQDYRPALSRITAPTLILVGRDDELAIAGSKSYKPIPNSKFTFVERDQESVPAGHFVFDESPASFSQIVAEFLTY